MKVFYVVLLFFERFFCSQNTEKKTLVLFLCNTAETYSAIKNLFLVSIARPTVKIFIHDQIYKNIFPLETTSEQDVKKFCDIVFRFCDAFSFDLFEDGKPPAIVNRSYNDVLDEIYVNLKNTLDMEDFSLLYLRIKILHDDDFLNRFCEIIFQKYQEYLFKMKLQSDILFFLYKKDLHNIMQLKKIGHETFNYEIFNDLGFFNLYKLKIYLKKELSKDEILDRDVIIFCSPQNILDHQILPEKDVICCHSNCRKIKGSFGCHRSLNHSNLQLINKKFKKGPETSVFEELNSMIQKKNLTISYFFAKPQILNDNFVWQHLENNIYTAKMASKNSIQYLQYLEKSFNYIDQALHPLTKNSETYTERQKVDLKNYFTSYGLIKTHIFSDFNMISDSIYQSKIIYTARRFFVKLFLNQIEPNYNLEEPIFNQKTDSTIKNGNETTNEVENALLYFEKYILKNEVYFSLLKKFFKKTELVAITLLDCVSGLKDFISEISSDDQKKFDCIFAYFKTQNQKILDMIFFWRECHFQEFISRFFLFEPFFVENNSESSPCHSTDFSCNRYQYQKSESATETITTIKGPQEKNCDFDLTKPPKNKKDFGKLRKKCLQETGLHLPIIDNNILDENSEKVNIKPEKITKSARRKFRKKINSKNHIVRDLQNLNHDGKTCPSLEKSMVGMKNGSQSLLNLHIGGSGQENNILLPNFCQNKAMSSDRGEIRYSRSRSVMDLFSYTILKNKEESARMSSTKLFLKYNYEDKSETNENTFIQNSIDISNFKSDFSQKDEEIDFQTNQPEVHTKNRNKTEYLNSFIDSDIGNNKIMTENHVVKFQEHSQMSSIPRPSTFLAQDTPSPSDIPPHESDLEGFFLVAKRKKPKKDSENMLKKRIDYYTPYTKFTLNLEDSMLQKNKVITKKYPNISKKSCLYGQINIANPSQKNDSHIQVDSGFSYAKITALSQYRQESVKHNVDKILITPGADISGFEESASNSYNLSEFPSLLDKKVSSSDTLSSSNINTNRCCSLTNHIKNPEQKSECVSSVKKDDTNEKGHRKLTQKCTQEKTNPHFDKKLNKKGQQDLISSQDLSRHSYIGIKSRNLSDSESLYNTVFSFPPPIHFKNKELKNAASSSENFNFERKDNLNPKNVRQDNSYLTNESFTPRFSVDNEKMPESVSKQDPIYIMPSIVLLPLEISKSRFCICETTLEQRVVSIFLPKFVKKINFILKTVYCDFWTLEGFIYIIKHEQLRFESDHMGEYIKILRYETCEPFSSFKKWKFIEILFYFMNIPNENILQSDIDIFNKRLAPIFNDTKIYPVREIVFCKIHPEKNIYLQSGSNQPFFYTNYLVLNPVSMVTVPPYTPISELVQPQSNRQDSTQSQQLIEDKNHISNQKTSELNSTVFQGCTNQSLDSEKITNSTQNPDFVLLDQKTGISKTNDISTIEYDSLNSKKNSFENNKHFCQLLFQNKHQKLIVENLKYLEIYSFKNDDFEDKIRYIDILKNYRYKTQTKFNIQNCLYLKPTDNIDSIKIKLDFFLIQSSYKSCIFYRCIKCFKCSYQDCFFVISETEILDDFQLRNESVHPRTENLEYNFLISKPIYNRILFSVRYAFKKCAYR